LHAGGCACCLDRVSPYFRSDHAEAGRVRVCDGVGIEIPEGTAGLGVQAQTQSVDHDHQIGDEDEDQGDEAKLYLPAPDLKNANHVRYHIRGSIGL
jgi:hypothetical protein